MRKAWAAGRRELEHEFGKVRAYSRSDKLASGESGQVVAALRPVWLMSPSLACDALQLTESFDVIAYGEVSQVPVEEAVPALHRSKHRWSSATGCSCPAITNTHNHRADTLRQFAQQAEIESSVERLSGADADFAEGELNREEHGQAVGTCRATNATAPPRRPSASSPSTAPAAPPPQSC